MRLPPSAAAAAALVLLVCGCPKPAPTTTPAAKNSSADLRIEKLARVLRAADRRVVDDDLLSLLVDEDDVVRASAVLALGQIGEVASLPDVEKAAADPSAVTRANAAFSIGLLANPASLPTLLKLAEDPTPSVRAAAAEAIGRLRDPGGAPSVRSLLDDPDPSVRAAAGLAAWKFADPQPFLDPLIANLTANDAKVRMASSYALARLASAATAPATSGSPAGRLADADMPRVRAALVARVSDTEAEVRMQVARGLASPRDAGEFALVGTLSRDRSVGVRVNAARSLGYPGLSLKPYLERATTDRDQDVARAAIESVGKVGGAQAEELLTELLPRLEKGWLLEAAISALARVAPAEAPGLVAGLLINPDPVMRASAAAIIAEQRDPAASGAATVLLGDADARVQAAAIPIVVQQDGAVTVLLAGVLHSPDPVVRAAVAEAVGERFAHPRPAVESRDDLYATLTAIWAASGDDKLQDAKLSIVDAVAKAGKDDRTKAALDQALADPDIVVRRRAAARTMDVYAENRSKDVGPASDRPLSDYVQIVRWSFTPHRATITMQRPGSTTGQFPVDLDALAAPMAAWNFSQLAGKRFFDGLRVHRVVPNFVAQDGDPRGDGFGGPGYSIRDEFNPLPFAAGVIGMASDGKDTAGSQWFITLSAQPHLDGRYTSFGRVPAGSRGIVSQIRPGDTVVSIRIDEQGGAGATPSSNP